MTSLLNKVGLATFIDLKHNMTDYRLFKAKVDYNINRTVAEVYFTDSG